MRNLTLAALIAIIIVAAIWMVVSAHSIDPAIDRGLSTGRKIETPRAEPAPGNRRGPSRRDEPEAHGPSPGGTDSTAEVGTQLESDAEAYLARLDDFRRAVRGKDMEAVKAIRSRLILDGSGKEDLLQAIILANDKDICIYAGTILGKTGDIDRTVTFIREQATSHGPDAKLGRQAGQLPDGTPTESKAILMAVTVNALRCILERDNSDRVIGDAITLATSNGLSTSAREMIFSALLMGGKEPAEYAVRRVLDTTQDESVKSAIGLALSSRAPARPELTVSLAEQYERSPPGPARTALGIALASQLPIASALEFLCSHATEDLRTSDGSDAFVGIVTVGRRAGALESIKAVLKSQSSDAVRRALVQSAAGSSDQGAGDLVLDAALHDSSGPVRGQALSNLPLRFPGDAAIPILEQALAGETDDTARLGAFRGLLNVVSLDPSHASEALECAAVGLCRHGRGAIWASMVPALMKSSPNELQTRSLASVLSREASNAHDQLVSAAISKAISDQKQDQK